MVEREFHLAGLPYVAELVEYLLNNCRDKLENKTEPLLKAIIHTVLYPSMTIRKKCLVIITRLVRNVNGWKTTLAFLKQMELLMVSGKINFLKGEGDNALATTPQAIVEFLTAACSCTDLTNDQAQQIVIASLLPVNYPLVKQLAPNLWTTVSRSVRCNPRHVIAQRWDIFTKILIDEYKPIEVTYIVACFLYTF